MLHRHMLAEHIVEDIFVPNDTTMGASSGRIHVITGPNVSGKSCYMRQVCMNSCHYVANTLRALL